MQWTERQQQAIDARNSNLLVAAAAGSGKTAVLVERICALVREGATTDRLLVVTFTRAAAAEMREKILGAFQRAADSDDPQAERFAEQAARVERAQISTLHGFCGQLLRTHFQQAGVDPTFRVGEDKETQTLLDAALSECLSESYALDDPDFTALAAAWSDAQVMEQVRALLHGLEAQAEPWAWLEQTIESYRMDEKALAESAWTQAVLNGAMNRVAEAEASFAHALHVCQLPGGCGAYLNTLQSDLLLVQRLREAARQGYEALRLALAEQTFGRMPNADKLADPEKVELAKALRNEGKKCIQKKVAEAVARPLAEQVADLHAQAPQIRALAALARRVTERYDAKKQERNLLDYADLEHKALAAVADPAVAAQVRAQYDYIFIDEYQDSSLIQETLIQRIAGERNVFLVGDVKQSIYRFRQAEPRLFLEKYRASRTEEGALQRRVDLNQNFRSRANVLASVNAVFGYAMREDATEIAYDEEARLYPGLVAEGEDPATELHILTPAARGSTDGNDADEAGEAEDKADEGGAEDTFSVDNDSGAALSEAEAAWQDAPQLRKAIHKEAKVAAARIRALVKKPYWDTKTKQERVLRYRDIVILLRVSSQVAQAVQQVLESEGIPVYSDTGDAYFAMPEVRMVIDILRAVDNPLRDDALLGALHGPAARLSNKTLAAIRQAHPEGSFAEAVAYCAAQEDALAERLRAFNAQLADFRLAAQAQPLEQVVWRICDETGCYARAGALPGGRTRQANLRLLAERAAAFGRTRGGGLAAFLAEVEQLKVRGDSDSAKPLSESEDVVRMMTMHKSKGLEFPVVICLDLGRSFLRRPAQASALQTHGQLGLALKFVDATLRTKHDTLAAQALRAQQAREALADAVRLLYVAMTRAQHQLILIGSTGGRGSVPLAQKLARWGNAAAGALLPEAATMLDLLLPPLLMHPAGGGLRELAEICDQCKAETASEIENVSRETLWQEVAKARWKIELHEGMEVMLTPTAQATTLLETLAASVRGLDPEIARVLLWQPPAPGGEAVRLKTSVSTLLRAAQPNDTLPELAPLPAFMVEQQGLDGAARGTAFHAAMRGLVLEALSGLSGVPLQVEIDKQLDTLFNSQRLTSAERAAVRSADIAPLFESATGQALLASDTVRREWAFNLRDANATRTQLIQGVLDCCFRTPEGWVLIDYKTDAEPSAQALLERYAPQVALYAQALARITGLPVIKRALYSTRQRALYEYPQEEA